MKERKTWIRIAQCHEIPLREGRVIKAGNGEVAVFNLGDRFLAIESRCPRKGGPLADWHCLRRNRRVPLARVEAEP
jgi:nitrite reductase/ring-hydroxylating ferredoxin subunit